MFFFPLTFCNFINSRRSGHPIWFHIFFILAFFYFLAATFLHQGCFGWDMMIFILDFLLIQILTITTGITMDTNIYSYQFSIYLIAIYTPWFAMYPLHQHNRKALSTMLNGHNAGTTGKISLGYLCILLTTSFHGISFFKIASKIGFGHEEQVSFHKQEICQPTSYVLVEVTDTNTTSFFVSTSHCLTHACIATPCIQLVYSVKFWQVKTLVNWSFQSFGEENFGIHY